MRAYPHCKHFSQSALQQFSKLYRDHSNGSAFGLRANMPRPSHTSIPRKRKSSRRRSTCELVEVGGYLDPEGNDFWGVEVIPNPDDDPNVDGDEVLILASDRDYGLFIFRDP